MGLGLLHEGRKAILVGLIILASLLVLGSYKTPRTVRAADPPYILTDPITKKVELTYTRTNAGRRTLTNLRIYFAVPASLPDQEIWSLYWSPQPTRYVYNIFGQKIAEFYIGTLRPGQGVAIKFTAVGRFWRIKYNVDPSKVGSLDEIPREIVNLYTTDGPYYRITDPLIVSTAHRIVENERNPYLMALLLHDFVARTLDYENDWRWDDAATVLRRGTGSCSEFTFVFISLARAVGLPARYAGGSIYKPWKAVGGRYVDKTAHRWAEVYIPNYGWVPFDPTWDRASSAHPVSHEYVGSHGHALVMARGGGTDDRYLGMGYWVWTRWHGSSRLESEWEFIWSNP